MLKSCSRCGRVHENTYNCGNIKRQYKSKGTSVADKYRNTREWKALRKEIVQRDKALCQICIRKLFTYSSRIYNNNMIEVHHIVPINEEYELRNVGSNLISLCPYHHKLAENGGIPKDILINIVKDQESNNIY